MSLVQFTYIQTLHEEQKIVTHTLVATESMFVFWSALWNFPKPENSFILCWEKFAFSFHLLYIWIKRLFYVWLKKPRKWRKHWVTMLFTNVFLSCRFIFFLQVIRGAKIQCREESIMRHLPCSPSCPYSASYSFLGMVLCYVYLFNFAPFLFLSSGWKILLWWVTLYSISQWAVSAASGISVRFTISNEVIWNWDSEVKALFYWTY